MGVGAHRQTGQRLRTNLTKCTSVRVCCTYSLKALTHGHSMARQIRSPNPDSPHPVWAHPDVFLHNNAGVCTPKHPLGGLVFVALPPTAMCDYLSWPIDNGSMRRGATAKFTYQVSAMSVRVEQAALLMRFETTYAHGAIPTRRTIAIVYATRMVSTRSGRCSINECLCVFRHIRCSFEYKYIVRYCW